MSDRLKGSITITELAYIVGTKKRIIERMVKFELIEPIKQDPEFIFESETIPIIKRLIRLHSQLGVSWSSMALVTDLLDRIEDLESQLKDP